MADSAERFSSGGKDLDRLLGGGFRRGSMVLLRTDETVEPGDVERLLTPTLLNFLFQSRGVIAVLPARVSPHQFRAHLTQWVGRRRFDSRVRVVTYVGEDDEAPYVVHIESAGGRKDSAKTRKTRVNSDMSKMVAAEKAARGARGRVILELVAFEIAEMVAGPETAARMFFHGIKRVQGVGNLCLGIMRNGLESADSLQSLAETELSLHRNDAGLILTGIRPKFPGHRVETDPRLGEPHLSLSPAV